MKSVLLSISLILCLGRSDGNVQDIGDEFEESSPAESAWEEVKKANPGITLAKLFHMKFHELDKLPKMGQLISRENRINFEDVVDVAKNSELLGRVARLLHISYAGCKLGKGLECKEILGVVSSSFQEMVDKAYLTSHEFVTKSSKALVYHGLAVTQLELKNTEQAKTEFLKSSNPANYVKSGAKSMQNLLDGGIIEKAGRAFLKIAGNVARKQKEVRRNFKIISVASNQSAEISANLSKNNHLEKKIAQEISELANEKEMQKLNRKERITRIEKLLSTLKVAQSTVLKKLADDPQRTKKEQETHKKSSEMLQKLVKDIQVIESSTVSIKVLRKCIQKLEIAQSAMAISKTLFLTVNTFWQGMNKAGGRNDGALEIAEILGVDQVTLIESGLSWIGLGTASVSTRDSMKALKRKTTGDFASLPDEDEAKKLIATSKSFMEKTIELYL